VIREVRRREDEIARASKAGRRKYVLRIRSHVFERIDRTLGRLDEQVVRGHSTV
jgi:hypothetical protein